MKFLIVFSTSIAFLLSPASSALLIKSSYKEKIEEINKFLDIKDPFYLTSKTYYSGGEARHWQYPNELTADPILGRTHSKSVEVRHIKRTANRIIYDAIYTFDDFGRRYAEINNPEQRHHFIVLYGCSFTYGNGLSDNQTLNYFLGQKLSDYFPYNYAIGATGSNSMLGLIEKNEFYQQIKEKNGVFIYVFIDAHVDRSNGLLPSLLWNGTTPYYEEDNGHLVRSGFLNTGRAFTTKFYLFIHKLLKLINRDNVIFPAIGSKENNYTCQLISESKTKFLNQYPDGKFVMYVHPLSIINSELENCLSSKKVKLIKGQRLPPNSFISGDGHPNELANRLISDELAKWVQTNAL